jgi:DNA-binding transcriptional LysR family regulator
MIWNREEDIMAVKLELYRVFNEVAETGNISLAARNLYISQSAVSQSIKQLETVLQARLFSRSPRGVVLTSEGQMLYEYVRSALGLISTGEDKLSQAQQLLLGTLVIGASDTVTSWFLTPYLERFHREYPGIRLKIVSGRSAKVLSLLKSGAVDIAFASSPADQSNLTDWPCFSTHTAFVVGSNYHCDFDSVYSLHEIAEFPLILLERKASSRIYLEQYFLKCGIRLVPEIELSSRSLLVSLAQIGLGVAGVTLEFVQKALDAGEIRLLKTDFTIPARSVDMCTLRDVSPTAAASRFMEMVQAGTGAHSTMESPRQNYSEA